MKYYNLIVVILLVSLSSCGGDDDPGIIEEQACEIVNVLPKGDRLIGIDLLDISQTNSFDDNLNLASDLGIEFIALHITWPSIETAPNTFEDPDGTLAALNQVAIANDFKFSLTIRPIDLTGKTVPSDLENVRFNDTQMVDRFKQLTDFIFSKVDTSILLNFQIGNEIDGYDTSSEPSTFWEDYGEFLNEMTAYVHSIDSSVQVGFTATLPGLLQEQNLFNDLMQNVDLLGVTYYPLNSDFSVKEPNAVFSDLELLTNAFTAKPIYLQEVGYQTSGENNSSQEKQAQFFCNFFQAWDTHNSNIKSANIVRLNDLSEQSAQASAAAYNISSTEFIEYLKTLGLRTYDGNGTNKQAFDIIKNNLVERGW